MFKMSTENNINHLLENSVKILTDLIGFRTISGEDNSQLISYCEKFLNDLGVTSFKTYDSEKKRVNLFATIKAKKSELGRKITSLTLMTIMVAGGLTFAFPGVMPEAMAANANLYVSAENSNFSNTMVGPQVVEVVVIDFTLMQHLLQ
jgi:hypothetical protein